MAVSFAKKSKLDIVLAVGGDALSAKMKEQGVSLLVSMEGFILTKGSSSVTVDKVAPLPQLKSGVASKVAEKQLKLFTQGYNALVWGGPTVPGGEALKCTHDAMFKISAGGLKGGEAGKALGKKALMCKDPVKLADAEMVLQPVKSSGGASKYFVVAVSPKLKVAARLKNGNVSVRAEGDIQKYKKALVAAGFDIKGQYASFHVLAKSKELRYKTVGAALFGLGLPFDEVLHDASIIDGKGV